MKRARTNGENLRHRATLKAKANLRGRVCPSCQRRLEREIKKAERDIVLEDIMLLRSIEDGRGPLGELYDVIERGRLNHAST